MKRLDVYPRCISNYQLKGVIKDTVDLKDDYDPLEVDEISPQRNRNAKDCSLERYVPEYATFRTFEAVVSPYIHKCIFMMNIGAKEHYGISLSTTKQRVLAHTKSQMNFHTRISKPLAPSLRKNRHEVWNQKMHAKKLQNEGGCMNIETTTNSSIEEVMNIDQSKQVILRAGSLKLDNRNFSKSKSKSKRREPFQIIGLHSKAKPCTKSSNRTPTGRNNFCFAPSVVPIAQNKSLLSTPRRGKYSSKYDGCDKSCNSSTTRSAKERKRRKKTLKDLLGGGGLGHTNYISRSSKKIPKFLGNTCEKNHMSMSSLILDEKDLSYTSKKIVPMEDEGIKPYWRVSRAQRNAKRVNKSSTTRKIQEKIRALEESQKEKNLQTLNSTIKLTSELTNALLLLRNKTNG